VPPSSETGVSETDWLICIHVTYMQNPCSTLWCKLREMLYARKERLETH
jgi:hypothetical protein